MTPAAATAPTICDLTVADPTVGDAGRPDRAPTADQHASRLVREDGSVIRLDVGAWSSPADALERSLLGGLSGPVLDIGCGPGRLVVALGEMAIAAMGVDASPVAVDLAVRRNAAALVRSVFDHVPGAGRWPSALLFDGNIGIGGDPARLLARTAQLLAPAGHLLVETGAPAEPLRCFRARLERGPDASEWFPWAQIGVNALSHLAPAAGFTPLHTVAHQGRWFVDFERNAR